MQLNCSAARPQYWVAAGVLLFAVVATLYAQQTPTFSVNVKVVNVLATVRDKHGNIVNTLGKDDFTLEEDGRPQSIRYFARDTDVPLTLGLLVDVSMSQIRVIDEEQTASAGFTNDVLRADKDSAFLIQFAHEVELLQDLTKSPLKMQESLNKLNAPRMDDQSGGNNGGGYPGGGHGGGGHRGGGAGAGTLLYDSIFLASDEMMQKQKGRKAVVVLTDGVDHGSKMSLDRAIESAQRADTIVYSIYFAGNEGRGWTQPSMGGGGGGRHGGGGWPGGGGGGWPGGGGGNGGGGYPQPQQRDSADGKKVLERLSKETGGRMFVVSKKETISQIYAQIQDELRNQYNIGYTPDRAPDNTSDYRHITVATKQKDYAVQAREGYYASRQLDEKQGQ
jgi:VWFA-related protein